MKPASHARDTKSPVGSQMASTRWLAYAGTSPAVHAVARPALHGMAERGPYSSSPALSVAASPLFSLTQYSPVKPTRGARFGGGADGDFEFQPVKILQSTFTH